MGQSYRADGRLEEALANYESARVLADEVGQPFDQTRVRYGLGTVCHALGRDECAREHWAAALFMLAALGTTTRRTRGPTTSGPVSPVTS